MFRQPNAMRRKILKLIDMRYLIYIYTSVAPVYAAAEQSSCNRTVSIDIGTLTHNQLTI